MRMQLQQQQQQRHRRRKTSKLALEPNPFERSFLLARSEDVSKSGGEDTSGASQAQNIEESAGPRSEKALSISPVAPDPKEAEHGGIETTSENKPGNTFKQGSGGRIPSPLPKGFSQNITLPPVTAINSPLGMESTSLAWGSDSLRCGPLSPAMLGGPTAPISRPRTTPRLGMTDPTLHSGLTPYIAGESHPTSSNNASSGTSNSGLSTGAATDAYSSSSLTTAASASIAVALATESSSAPNGSVSNNIHKRSSNIASLHPSSLASPGIQALINAAANGRNIGTTPGGSYFIAPTPHPVPMQSPHEVEPVATMVQQRTSSNGSRASNSATSGTSPVVTTTASLSTMLKQEPTMLQTGSQGSRTVIARESSLPTLAPIQPLVSKPQPSSVAQSYNRPLHTQPEKQTHPRPYISVLPVSQDDTPTQTTKAQGKKQSKKGASNLHTAGYKKANEDDDEAPEKKRARNSTKKSSSAATLPNAQPENSNDNEEVSDEKRRQFLERNRIAALKCRQRKKQQLKELQNRHDYMVYENSRLKNEYIQLRDQALHIKTLLEAHRECPVAQANGVFGIDSLPPGTPNISSQPILFNLSDDVQSGQLKELISAIPPTSNGLPINNIDPATGEPFMRGFGEPIGSRPSLPPSHMMVSPQSIPPPSGLMPPPSTIHSYAQQQQIPRHSFGEQQMMGKQSIRPILDINRH